MERKRLREGTEERREGGEVGEGGEREKSAEKGQGRESDCQSLWGRCNGREVRTQPQKAPDA